MGDNTVSTANEVVERRTCTYVFETNASTSKKYTASGLRATRTEYQVYPPKVISDHISQEQRNRKEEPYCLVKKKKKKKQDEKEAKARRKLEKARRKLENEQRA